MPYPLNQHKQHGRHRARAQPRAGSRLAGLAVSALTVAVFAAHVARRHRGPSPVAIRRPV
jgi:hypothetical protein